MDQIVVQFAKWTSLCEGSIFPWSVQLALFLAREKPAIFAKLRDALVSVTFDPLI